MTEAELATGSLEDTLHTGTSSPPRKSRVRSFLPFLPLAPASLFFIAFLIAPLGVVFYYSLQSNPLIGEATEGLSFANYVYFFQRSHYVNVIFRTLRLALITTVVSVVIGYLATLVLRQMSERLGSTAVLVLAFPILAGPIVTVMGWMVMLTSTGLVGRTIALTRQLLGLPEISTRLLGTDTAVIIGMIHFNLAFVILSMLNVMLKIDPTLEEAAMNLGANRLKVFFRVILPLSLPGVLSASLISFALAMNAFVNPTYLGNRSRLVLTTQISQFMSTSFNWQMASATGVILLWISLAIIVVYNNLVNRAIK